MQQVVSQRWGTTQPILPQTTTMHVLSSETVGQESVVLEPIMTSGSNFVVLGSLATAGAAFSPSGVTHKVRASPGTLLQLSGMPAGASAGQLVLNVTNQSYAFIDSIAGGVAVMTQPLTAGPLTTVTNPAGGIPYVEDDAWLIGNTYQRYNLPQLNLKVFDIYGGDSNSAFTTTVAWMQFVHVVDDTGLVGYSNFVPRPLAGMQMELSTDWIDPYFIYDDSGEPYSPDDANCYLNGGAQHLGATMIGGSMNTALPGNSNEFWKEATIDGDAIVHADSGAKGSPYDIFGYVYIDADMDVAHGGTILLENAFFGGNQLWGPGDVNLNGNGSSFQATGTYGSSVTVSSLEITGLTTGSAYQRGRWFDGISLTPANIDTWSGLQNPLTSAMFAVTGAAETDTVNPLQAIQKPTDQSVTSSTGLVNETAMQVTMAASDTWVVTWTLYTTFASAAGIQVAATVPTGATLNLMAVGVPINTTAQSADAEQTTSSGTGIDLLDFATSGTSGVVTVTATVVGDGTHAGTIVLQFTQTGSSGTSTTVKAGSGMTAVRH